MIVPSIDNVSQPLRRRLLGPQGDEDPRLDPCLGPAVEPHVDRVPVAELGWQPTLGAALFRDVVQRIQDLALGNRQLPRGVGSKGATRSY